jgi:hypothetical protein
MIAMEVSRDAPAGSLQALRLVRGWTLFIMRFGGGGGAAGGRGRAGAAPAWPRRAPRRAAAPGRGPSHAPRPVAEAPLTRPPTAQAQDEQQPRGAPGAGGAAAAAAAPPPPWRALPAPALALAARALPPTDRLRMRLACRAFAAAAADAFAGVTVDLAAYEAAGPAGAAALARACPLAEAALLRADGGADGGAGGGAAEDAGGGPGGGSLQAAAEGAIAALLGSKPRLGALRFQDLRPAWHAGPHAGPDWLAALAAAAAAATSAAGGAALPPLRSVELEVHAAPPPPSLAALRAALPGLRRLAVRMRSPHEAGVAPEGAAEAAGFAALEALELPVDSRQALQVRERAALAGSGPRGLLAGPRGRGGLAG